MSFLKAIALTASFFFLFLYTSLSQDSTYAEKLGYPRGSKVVILHVDDAGMSYESNEGAIAALTKGVATSVSVMMPCPWVPGFVKFLKENPQVDAGLHLTLTSEWSDYRWSSVSGKLLVPGLVDNEGAMWSTVNDVVKNATPQEIEREMNAQLERAKTMGFTPTHFDSHMGTLFATPAFFEKYLTFGIKNKIPVMIPGGANKLIASQMKLPEELIRNLQAAGRIAWNAGLPVLDDLHNDSYNWEVPEAIRSDDKKLQAYKTEKYIEALKSLQPGITMIIMHCTATSPVFPKISDSGPTRRGDMLAMMDPKFKKALADEKIILTTFRELAEKRKALDNK